MSSSRPGSNLQLRHDQVHAQLHVQRHEELVRLDLSRTAQQIAMATLRILKDRKGNHTSAYHQVITDGNIHAIADRITRDVIFDFAREGISLLELPLGKDQMQMYAIMEEKIDDRFNRWWVNRHQYVPDGKTEAQIYFYQQYPEARPIIHPTPGVVPSPEAKGNALFSEVNSCLEASDAYFKIDPIRRRTFDQIRSATYNIMSADNIDALLPKVQRAYYKDWLKPETLQKLAHNDPDQLEQYVEEVEKGIFVFGFDEKVNGKPSIREQMHHDLTREYAPNEPRYKGRYLEDENGEIMAWFTYWESQGADPTQYVNMIRQNLMHGATGGNMEYTRKPRLSDFEPYLKNVFMIDTIQGVVPGAAARLFAKALLEVFENDPSLLFFVGYRLHELHMNEPFAAFNEPISFHDNIGSGKFFGSRKCTHLAFDFNQEGPASERIIMGEKKLLLPEWDWFYGKFIDVLRRAWRYWQLSQSSFADLSPDGYKSSIVERARKPLDM